MLVDCSHLEVTTAPTFTGQYPVPLDELKSFLRVTFSDDDAELTRMIETVTLREQDYLGIQIPTATYTIYFDGFDRLEIARPPVTAITSVNYLDSSGTATVLATSNYRVTQLNQRRRPAVITRAYSTSWPTTRSVERNVWVVFTCGWATVPADVKALIMHGVEEEYEGKNNAAVMDRLRGNLRWTSAI